MMISPANQDAALDAIAFTRALIAGDQGAQWVILNNTAALDLIHALAVWWINDLVDVLGSLEAVLDRLSRATQGIAGAS